MHFQEAAYQKYARDGKTMPVFRHVLAEESELFRLPGALRLPIYENSYILPDTPCILNSLLSIT